MNRMAMLLTLILIPVVAFSATPLKFGAGPQVGLSFSSFPDPAKDWYGTGIGFGAHGDMEIIKYVGIRLNLDYHMFGANTDKIAEQITQELVHQGYNVRAGDIKVEGLSAKVLGITINGLGKIPTASPLTPYGLLGFGIHSISISDPKVTVQNQAVQAGKPEGETKFGINFGAGTEFGVSKLVTLYFDIKYVIIFTSDNSTKHIPLTVGATFGF
jgi:opacity protein-like surface antigen